MDETDDSMLWNGSAEEGNVRNECQEDEDTDCEDGESNTISKGRQNPTCFVH